ncbi:MAG: TIGR03067 domain-containing protein [Gemmataceae bacterium]|nr:TIGR03067 domain-containing protein [Gemmataceae bacterium]
MAIVSCPECSKKLKVADTSVGKKVKCSCGHIFIAEGAEAAPTPAPLTGAAPEKVVVACSACSAKLKVAATSLGKKMKCPKCAGVFVAAVEEEAPPPMPVKKAPPVMEDEEESAQEDDDEDFFAYGKKKGVDDDDDDDDIKPKAKAKATDEDDDEPKPRRKSPPPPSADDDDDEPPPVYPSTMLATLFAVVLLLVYAGLFTVTFFGYFDIAESLGLPKPIVLPGKGIPAKEDDLNKDKDKEKGIDNKKAAAKLNGTWIVESAAMPGLSLDAMKGLKFTFADGVVTTPDLLEAPFTVDASKNPKWIELPTAAKVHVPGIYSLDGDTLKWCTALPKVDGKKVLQAADRPTEFDAKQGILIVLKREKGKGNGEKNKDKEDGKDDPKDKGKDKDAEKDKDGNNDKRTGNLVGLLEVAGDAIPTWKVPEGWKEAKGTSFTVGSFAVKDKEASASITVSLLRAPAGGVLANVNRWRSQLKLEPWSDAELAKLAKKMTVSGTEGTYVELVGPASTTLGVIVFHDTQAWFFKLTGDNDLAQREKANFTKFMKSVKFR